MTIDDRNEPQGPTDMGDVQTEAPEQAAAPKPVETLELLEKDIELRARPRPVTRINRRMLGIAVGAGGLLLFGIALVALDPPNLRSDGQATQLYNVGNTQRPEGLEELPQNYAQLPPTEPDIPELGPPLPGDLGGPILEAQERNGGQLPTYQTPPPVQSNPEEDAARAERIRQAQLIQAAREAGVFFSLGSRSGSASVGNGSFGAGSFATASPSQASAYAAQGGSAGFNQNVDSNFQGRKQDFVGQRGDDAIYNPHRLQDPASPYQVMAGTIIPASLVTGINSDLPGQVIAQVTEHIYDTPTGRYLLIPQGTRIIGRYDSVVAFGQNRALLVWTRLIMPDGSSIQIDNLPGTDAQGYAGLEDDVDFHTWRLIGGIGLSTLLGVGTELTLGDNEGDLVEAIRESTQDSANRAGQRITQRNLDIQPTITVRPGWPLRIIVSKDLVLRPYGEGEGS